MTETKDSPGRGYPLLPFPMPIYPYTLLWAGIAGDVDVRLVIDKDGLVTDATVVRSTHKEFEEPTLAAVRHWRFVELLEPGGKERHGLVEICRIEFSFDDE